ncbi:LytTR family DNA-binding domain-containing protein [Variovorax sp. PCZ-1]|uniref:LytR/AlgR family response regulator transcription factor n=1 Tax=Variovorax sp. PCZ-1 TaxID=2835533 RepID=UPI001BD16DFA|nr:LytTR family DNA-binding domain-containing protein [Variovorax sp. PCZ-1]MBS7806723.1 response regulator transcription factor [Variovorax sp. PCZ-1]
MSEKVITALIAEDEPLLAQSLQRELHQLWPELQTHIATDGLQAVEQALSLLPQILLFDVRMPGQSGLDAAQEIAERWPPNRSLPLLVFITAFDEYAVKAFEQAAIDYIVKPVKPQRLQQTLERIKHQIHISAGIESAQSAIELIVNSSQDESQLSALRTLLRTPPDTPIAAPRLQRIQASVGNQIVIVPLSEVAYFEAADKYVRVLTGIEHAERELLIRTPIKDLLPQLDPNEFWQIHRSTLVRASLIDAVHRDEAARMSLSLHGRSEKLVVSRLYAGLFKAM